ncbi:MAG: DUF6364 family protein [Gallionella sp.]
MRTTLDIDKAVLDAAKELARSQNVSTGQVVSNLLRKVLTGQSGHVATPTKATKGHSFVAGFRPFSTGQEIVTNEAVNHFRESEGI